jgi:hypothetical protein
VNLIKDWRNKMKKSLLVLIIILVLIFLGMIFLIIRGNEDDWIKDSRGLWIKHGNPSDTPNYVLEQQKIINCAFEKFDNFSDEINSQCLGVCDDYAVDIVHVPRSVEDNKIENQCEDYANGVINHFIELDKDENVVRIV